MPSDENKDMLKKHEAIWNKINKYYTRRLKMIVIFGIMM